MKRHAVMLVVATMIVSILSGCGDITREDASRGIVNPNEGSILESNIRSETDKEQEIKDYFEKKMAEQNKEKESDAATGIADELNEELANSNRSVAENIINEKEKEEDTDSDSKVDINIDIEPKEMNFYEYTGEILVIEQEAIGGIAGTDYIDKGQEIHKLKDDERTTIYSNDKVGFTVWATQRDSEAVVLEFSGPVINCDSEQDFAQEIEKELLDKGKTITINYPYGTGGILLTIVY